MNRVDKIPDRLTGHSSPKALVSPTGSSRKPNPDPRWRPEAYSAWQAFWDAPVSELWDESDEVQVRSLCALISERALCESEQNKSQDVDISLGRYVISLNGEIRKSMEGLGLGGPLSRLRIGVASGEAQREGESGIMADIDNIDNEPIRIGFEN